MASLPVVGADRSRWGEKLLGWLRTHGNEDGTLKRSAVNAALNRYIDARDYGLGDGFTTDVTAIQTAYNVAQGRLVYLPKGTWDLKSTQLTGPYVPKFVGDGMDETIIHYTSPSTFGTWSGSIGASISLLSDATIGDTQLNIPTAGLAVDDYLFLRGDGIFSVFGEPANKQGEFVRIYSIDDANHLTVYGHIVDTYTLANSAKAHKMFFMNGARFEGFSLINDQPSVGNGGAAVFNLHYFRRLKVEDVHIDSSVGAVFDIAYAVDWEVLGCSFKDVSSWEEYPGSSLGYGVMAYGASTDGVVHGCRSSGGHHMFTTNGDPTIGGIPRNVVVSACTARDNTEAPFHTHPACEFITFDGCSVFGGGKKTLATVYSHGFSLNGKRCTLNNPVVKDLYGCGILLGNDSYDCLINNPDIVACRQIGAASGSSSDAGNGILVGVASGHDINGAHKIVGGRINDCDFSGIYVFGGGTSGPRIKGSYIKAGNAASGGGKYCIYLNDSSDTTYCDDITGENADEVIHIISPVTATAKHSRIRGIGSVKLSNQMQSIISTDRDNGQLGIVAPTARGWLGGNATLIANEGSIVRFIPSRDYAMTLFAFIVITAASADDACCLAIYDSAMNRLATTGATTGKLNSAGVKTIALNYTLLAGKVYYAFFSCGAVGGTAAIVQGANFNSSSAGILFGAGNGVFECAMMTAAHPAPATFVPATPINLRPVIALREI